jgi:hypothetical protein
MQKLILVIIIMAMPASVYTQEQQLPQMNDISQINEISMVLAELTGTAINPLLVTTAMGIYRNIASSADEKRQLPWHYQPWFLIICGILVLMSFLVSIPPDIFNTPPQVSKIVELMNKRLGLVLATPALYGLIAPLSSQLADNMYTGLTVNNTYIYASIIPFELLAGLSHFLWLGISSALMFFIYAAIWLLNYVIDFLILLCPFGWVDTVLKSARAFYFGLLFALTAINPVLGFILTLPVIIIAVLLFGWSVRRVVMSFVFLRDFKRKKKETVIDDRGILAFSEPCLKIPNKCMGRLNEKDGKWSFVYRKSFMWEKTIVIDKMESFFKKGFLYSQVFANGKLLFSLPPRYQKITEQVQMYLRIEKLDDSSLKKGIKELITWVKDIFYHNAPSLQVDNQF